MAIATPHGLGRELRFFATLETTFGTYVAPSVAGGPNEGLKVTASGLSFSQARIMRNDSRTTRSLLERITGKKEVTWSCEAFINPPGDQGTVYSFGRTDRRKVQ